MTKEQATKMVDETFEWFYDEFGTTREENYEVVIENFIELYITDKMTLKSLKMLFEVLEFECDYDKLEELKEKRHLDRTMRKQSRRRKREGLKVKYFETQDGTLFKTINDNVDYWINTKWYEEWNEVDSEHGPYPTATLKRISEVKAFEIAKRYGMKVEEFFNDKNK